MHQITFEQEARMELEELVIAQYPAARTTLEVSRQLADMLPIESAEDLGQRLEERPLVVDDEPLQLAHRLSQLPEDAFPVSELPDLVAKVAGAVRVAAALAQQGRITSRSERLARLALDLGSQPAGGRAGVPAGHFPGPSLFGYEEA